MSTSDRKFSNRGTMLRRINIYFPWIKLVGVLIVGLVIILDLLDVTVSKARDPYDRIKIAPMSKHVRSTDRNLTGKKLVALTFDDGPSPATTPKLLDILAKKDVPVTFFMLGSMAKKSPEIVKRAEREGHVVASHTMYHQNLARISKKSVEIDVNESKKVFKDVVKHEPKLTRPPYGSINNNVRKVINTPLILWSVDTEDWRDKKADAIVKTAMSEIHDGAIILMHDIYPTSVDAVSSLIDTVRKSGYEFVTVFELAEMRKTDLKKGIIYYNIRP